MPLIPRMLLLGMGLVVLVALGCKERQEAPAPQKPAVVRKRIEAPQPPAAEAVKPPEEEAVGPATAEAPPTEQVPEQPPLEQPAPELAKVEPPVEVAPAAPEAALKPEEVPEGVAPEEAEKEVYAYDAKEKIDPFRSVFVTQPQARTRIAKKVEERKLPLTPLQKLDVSQLKVVGIIISPTGNKALVEDPGGKGYVVTQGTYIGSNFGRVSKILGDRIVVEEEVEDFFTGQMKIQPVELRLQEKFGEL
jgi:type IV pilus assembly protein PilP